MLRTNLRHFTLIHQTPDGQVWAFSWTEISEAETLRLFGQYAANPKLSFTWNDAARCCKKVHDVMWRAKHGNESLH